MIYTVSWPLRFSPRTPCGTSACSAQCMCPSTSTSSTRRCSSTTVVQPMGIVQILPQVLLLQSLILIVVVLLLLVLLLVVLVICSDAILLVRVTVHVISLHFNPVPEPGFYHMYCMKNMVFLL